MFPPTEEITTTLPYFDLNKEGVKQLDNANQVAYPFPTIRIRYDDELGGPAILTYTSDSGQFTYYDLASLLLARAQQTKTSNLKVYRLFYNQNGYYTVSSKKSPFYRLVCDKVLTIPDNPTFSEVCIFPFSSTWAK